MFGGDLQVLSTNNGGIVGAIFYLSESGEGIWAMLTEEIVSAQRLVRTDAYQMSIGEIVSMYDNREIIIDPEFQRLFRWDIGQKSKLIESPTFSEFLCLPSSFLKDRTAAGNSSMAYSGFLQSSSSWVSFAAPTAR